jgi:putative ABC transport system permease protein
MLVRASLRGRELAVRTALGGSWWRLIRQMLTEAFLIAGAGANLGIGLAWAGIKELISIAPANIPRLDTVRIDPVVLLFAALAAFLAAVLFGLPPAIRTAKPDIMQVLRGSGRTAGLAGGGFLRNTVVVAEVALSFVLLIGSGLMIRSFIALEKVDPGFDAHQVLTFLLLGNRGGTTPEGRAALLREIQTRLASLPGVEKVSGSNLIPLAGGYNPIRWGTEQALVDPSKFQATNFQIVLPGYFETIRARLIAGRTFAEEDNAADGKRVIIDDLLARKAFGSESAVGKRILTRIRTPDPEWFEVVGVVAHQHQESLAESGREQIYVPDAYMTHGAIARWVLRTSGDPAKYIGPVRAEMASIDAHSLILEMQPMQAIVEHAQSGTRFQLLLIGTFAVIAAFLAAVGLYGVLSTAVRQRTSEIGVRMALGAAPSRIFSLFVAHGLELSATGVGVGLIAAVALTRLMSSMLIGVRATDPLTFIVMAVLFFIIAAVASWLPARRAANLDPTIALRDE